MKLNQKDVLKLLFLQSTAYYLLEFRCNFYFMPGPWQWEHSGAVSPNLVVPRKVCFKHTL